jgi:hypothetical protein
MPFRKHPGHKKVPRNPDSSCAFSVIPDLTVTCPDSRSGLFSVIPGLTVTCPDPQSGLFPSFRTRSGIHVHRDETAEELPEKNRNISGDLQPIKMDPGSSPGVTGTEEPRIRPAPFPSFLRKQESMFKWTPGQARGDGA